MIASSGENPEVPNGPHVIIAGFGIPGRFVAELLDFKSIPYCVIELNGSILDRCKTVPIVVGDSRDENVLRRAGIERATTLAVTLPVESVVHETIAVARKMRPDLYIMARVNYTSAGIKAHQMGADEVVIEEQLAAREFFRLIEVRLKAEETGKEELPRTAGTGA